MKDGYKILAVFLVVALLVAGNIFQFKRIEKLSAERDKYARNTDALLTDIETYKVNDSLNAAKTQALELTVKEFEKYRAEDAALIKQLRTKNRDLQSVVTNQSEMIVEMQSIPKDTVIIRDSIKIGAKVVHCGDEWYDFDGLLTDKEFTGNMVSRDSLLIAETVKYKRFLGFLWKTKQIKNREIDVVSKNPHNKIQNCEIITIE
jgi:hypothetical protein